MVVIFQDVLHGFCAIRGTGTAIMDIKMAQELASIDQEPLFLVFLDLRKAYDTLDCVRILQTLDRYGVGPKIRGLLEELWEKQEVVTRQNVYHGPKFRAARGTNQGGLASPILFNVVVDSVIGHWLYLAMEYEAVIQDGLVHTVGRELGVF